MKPHKHAKEIHAWADGHEIEEKTTSGHWWGILNPTWDESKEYRIKPQAEYLEVEIEIGRCYWNLSSSDKNLRLGFLDGKLVSAEVIK